MNNVNCCCGQPLSEPLPEIHDGKEPSLADLQQSLVSKLPLISQVHVILPEIYRELQRQNQMSASALSHKTSLL